MNTRRYAAGVVTGLVALAQQTCYFPKCSEPLVRFDGSTPVNNFEIAHICAINNGPRHVEGMSEEEANKIDNLVLFCLVHHKVVDKLRPQDFPPDLLRAWKSERESASYDSLRGLRELTEDRFQELMSDAFTEFKQSLNDAISRLGEMDRESAALLRPLVAQLAEANLTGRFPSIDTVEMLSTAATKLGGLADTAELLLAAAERIRRARGDM